MMNEVFSYHLQQNLKNIQEALNTFVNKLKKVTVRYKSCKL